MIITLHENKVHWQHAQPLVSLIDHMVYVFCKDSDTPIIGVVTGYTEHFMIIEEEEQEEGAEALFIDFNDIERIHYP